MKKVRHHCVTMATLATTTCHWHEKLLRIPSTHGEARSRPMACSLTFFGVVLKARTFLREDVFVRTFNGKSTRVKFSK